VIENGRRSARFDRFVGNVSGNARVCFYAGQRKLLFDQIEDVVDDDDDDDGGESATDAEGVYGRRIDVVEV
jgi:hypothetical protein